MFAKLFKQPNQSQSSPQLAPPNPSLESMLKPRVLLHYGIPSAASILAFDPIQRVLAIGTLDGRIKVIGGDNIEGLLISSKALPFKNLAFLQNQGFLVSVSNENEIQVWDLVKRCSSSSVQWESNITAFSVIPITNYIYIGDEYGFLSILKYDAEEGKIIQLPYHVPPNLVAEGAGISLPDNQPIAGVLSVPHPYGNRVLIAYESGLIILWDVTEDRSVHVRGYNDLQLKEGTVVNFSDNGCSTYLSSSLENEQGEKDISSLCWASPDGSVLAVGYVDGDILLWNLAISDSVKSQRNQNSSDDVVKIQLSTGDRRLPVIVLHWSSNKTQNGCGGHLFVYGGEAIGSEEVLTILDLDWSAGLLKLKCLERVDLTLQGSFADVIIVPQAFETDNTKTTSLFVLTNPGQLHFYDFASLSNLKSGAAHKFSVHPVQYHPVIPTVEPYMTLGKLYLIGSDSAFSEFTSEKLQGHDKLTGKDKKWPLTGGVPCSPSTIENELGRMYIGGYQDGSVRIWNATSPGLALVSVLEPEIKGFQISGACASVSALDFSSSSLSLAIGNEYGAVCLYRLDGTSDQSTFTLITETSRDVHQLSHDVNKRCSAIFSIVKSPVRALQFLSSGVTLFVGHECGRVVMLDTSSLLVKSVTDCVPGPTSSIISVAFKTLPHAYEGNLKNTEIGTTYEPVREVIFLLTRDAHVVLMDSSTGSMKPIHSKENSTAISMHLLEGKHSSFERSKKDSVILSQHLEAENHPLQTSNQDSSGLSEVEDPLQHISLESETLSQIFLCTTDAIYTYSLKSIFQSDGNFVNVLNLDKPCSWTTIFKKNAEEYGFILVYQTGEIEIRSLPDLELLGNTSMMSILRWSFKNNMEKTMSASNKGEITLVNGCEFAFVSLLALENEFSIASLPSLHDEALAAAANADVNFLQNQKKTQNAVQGFLSNMVKGLKGNEVSQNTNYIESREILIARLDTMFSRFPFSDPFDSLNQEDFDLHIDDIVIDEPIVTSSSSSSSQKRSTDIIKEKGTDRDKLFEGESTYTHPKVRSREEIIAKYRNTGDVAASASQAKEKLLERQEKLDKLHERTSELQSGAESFASMANELARRMEKRKWWNI